MTKLHLSLLNLSLTKLSLGAAVLLPTLLAIPALAQSVPEASPAPSAQAPVELKPREAKNGFHSLKLGVNLGIFLPTSGKARDRFGNSWTSIGIGIGRPDKPSGTGRFGLDFSTEYKKSGDHHAFVAPIGIIYRRAFNAADLEVNDQGKGHALIPYYGISADLVALDLRSPEDNVHSRFRLTEGGSALVGTTIGASGFAEAKYLAVGSVKSFNLSGFSLTVGVRF